MFVGKGGEGHPQRQVGPSALARCWLKSSTFFSFLMGSQPTCLENGDERHRQVQVGIVAKGHAAR